MSHYEKIIAKLRRFIRKFYVNELIKGTILFFAIGLLYFILTVALEYFFWFGTLERLILFWLFIAVEIALFGRFIMYSLLKLLRLSKGISYDEAANLIGKHFPVVNDKLLNVLQLKRVGESVNSELLLASIDQKSAELQPIPFSLAVNFKGNLKYLKYAAIPILILLGLWVSGKGGLFSNSYSRVINYETAYQPPAPFSFQILNTRLKGRENNNFVLRVKTRGDLVPRNAKIHYGGETYLLENKKPGAFSYTFDHLQQNIHFHLSANTVTSKSFTLQVVNVPTLTKFQMHLHYPAYLKKPDETVKGTGNATLPEGTQVSWQLQTKHTNQVKLEFPDTTRFFQKNKSQFTIAQILRQTTSYKIATANKQVKDYEELSYHLKVIQDQYPKIKVRMKRDTVTGESLYFHGRVSDDHGLKALQLVYYPVQNQKEKHVLSLPVAASNFDEFIQVFPDTLHLTKGTSYELYFRIYDNDAVNGSKATKSQLFSYHKNTDAETEKKQLKTQKSTIEGIDKTLKRMKKSGNKLKELSRMQKEKSHLNFNEQKKFRQYYDRQRQEDKIMKNYAKKMRRDLENFQKNKRDDAFKKQLKERLKRQEKRLEKNEKLLDELEKYRKKINQEKMAKKLEKLAKNKKNQHLSLEQLLELTKRYYIKQKAQRIAKDLHKLGRKQKELARKGKENTSKKQKALNQKFQDIRKALDSLQKKNEELKNPMEIDRNDAKEDSIQKQQKKATQELEDKQIQEDKSKQGESGNENEKNKGEMMQNPQSGASKMQKSAGQKMQQLARGMQAMMQMGSRNQMMEDIKSLRQILANLITFSFHQEDLMITFQHMDKDSPEFGTKLGEQFNLKENFEHVDDSLYALALRNPMISDLITEKLTDINFNLDKALQRLQKDKFRKGTAHQQYVLTGANELANMLDSALQNMQMMMNAAGSSGGQGMPKPGQGQGRGFQLPDIIQQQDALGKKMGGGMQKFGKKSGNKNQGEKKGKDGKKGKQGKKMGGGQLPSEEQRNARLYEIYKQQQKLRFELQNLIQKKNLGVNAKRMAKEMKQVEEQLLQRGFTKQTEEMMMHIKQHLLQLKNASYKQEQINQRQSKTNTKIYKTSSKHHYKAAKKYFNTTEILNRQSLPLQPDYKELIRNYFSESDD